MGDLGPEFGIRRATRLIADAVDAYRSADNFEEAGRARRLDRAMLDIREALLAWGVSPKDWVAPENVAANQLRWAMDVMGAALLAYERYRGQRRTPAYGLGYEAQELDRRVQHMATALGLWEAPRV
jgi:hypothetical protein